MSRGLPKWRTRAWGRLRTWPTNPPGYTLLEILLVMALLGLLSAMAALGLGHSLSTGRLGEAVQSTCWMDDLARQRARQSSRPLRLVLDIDEGRIACEDPQDNLATQSLRLGTGCWLAAVWTVQGPQTRGQVSIDYSPRGTSPTYAWVLAGPAGKRTIRIVAGLSGQISGCDDEKRLQTIFATLSRGGDEPG